MMTPDYRDVGHRVWQLGLSPDNGKLHAVNGLTNDVSIIDVASLPVQKSVPVGRLPWGSQ
jgi:YVTN family beta-propeller protein